MSTVTFAPRSFTSGGFAPVTPIGLARSAARPAAKPHLRITARGRAVLAIAIAVPIALLSITAIDLDAAATDTVATGEFSYVSVAVGESLWDVARYIAPEADPREVVADLVQLNALGSADVHAGERLAIPAEYAR